MSTNWGEDPQLVSACVPEAVRRVHVVRVVETVSFVGAGIKGNVAREVRQLWSLDGVLLATHDPSISGYDGWPQLQP